MGNQMTHGLSPMVIEDLEHETAFTAAELADLYRQFQHDCPHGKMHVDDFKRMYRDNFPKGNADKFAEHVFQVFDKDNDGEINFREFITTLSVQLKGSTAEKLGWAFDLYDTKHQGHIDKSELLDMVKSIHQLHAHLLPNEDKLTVEQVTAYIMSKADKDDDNKITRHEFVEAALTSKTLQLMIKGELKAAQSPFMNRKERRGSFGIPDERSRGRRGSEASSSRARAGSNISNQSDL